MRRRVLLALGLVILCGRCAAQGANLVANPGFETVANGAIQQWTLPTYWVGKLTSVDDPAHVHSGSRAALLQAAKAADGKCWGRIHNVQVPASFGLRYRLSVWAKGAGDVRLGIIYYRPDKAGLEPYTWAWQEQPLTLTDQWQQTSFEFTPVDVNVYRLTAAIAVEGEGTTALLDDVSLEVARRAEGLVRATPPYVMTRVGETAEVTVEATEADRPLANGRVIAIVRDPDEPRTEEIALDATGRATYSLQAGKLGLTELAFVVADLGAMATVNVDAVSAETYETFAEAAGEAQVGPLPAHLLFLGDSLTDFHRGWNYVDEVGFWLQKTHGEQVTVRNAGVGGDYITRVWQRLNGDPSAYRASMYDDLFEPKPTRVFIFLGHNDTKLTSGSGFTEAVVPLEEFEALFRQTIGKIRDETGAQVTLVSSTSSVYEITKPNAKKLLQSRGSASLFGKPEVLERYNAILKRIAEETGSEYVDVYEPTRVHPDKPSLFMADGVHVNLEGNHLLALEVLRALR
jgi:lysophospholipase L1-like esterase